MQYGWCRAEKQEVGKMQGWLVDEGWGRLTDLVVMLHQKMRVQSLVAVWGRAGQTGLVPGLAYSKDSLDVVGRGVAASASVGHVAA